MRIAHLSDFHYTALTFNPLRLFSKRILGMLNWFLHRNKEFSPQQIEDLPSLFRSLNIDLVLLGGDFTTTSMHEEFFKAKKFVSRLEQPWIAIPGNHDHYTIRSYKKKHYYKYFSNESASCFSLKEDELEGHKIAPGWWLIALNTAYPTGLISSRGCFSEKLEAKLEAFLKDLPQGERVIFFNHYPFFQNDANHRTLDRGEALENLLRRHSNIVLYLHGHTHRRIIADLQRSGLPLILDSGSCTQRKTGSWNLIDLSSEGCSVSPYRWNNGWEKTATREFQWTR